MIARHARLRLAAWYAAVFFAVLVVLGIAMYVALTISIDRQVDRGISAVADQWVATAPDPRTMPPIAIGHSEADTASDLFLLAYRSDGALVANPRRAANEDLIEHAVGNPLAPAARWRTVRVEHARYRILTLPVQLGGANAGVVSAGRSLAERDKQVATVVVTLGVVAGIGLLLAGGGGYLLAGRALRPLIEAYEGQRRFVGDASHELRAPLTVIRTASELILRQDHLPAEQRSGVEEIREVAVEAARLVDNLLDLARMEGAADPRVVPSGGVEIATVVAGELDRFAAECEAHRTTVRRTLASVSAAVTEDEVRRILRALVENVLQHTPPGTTCEVATAAVDSWAILAVEDSGPGVPVAARRAIFERFARLESARTPGTGTGLGLAIVRTLVQRRGGTVRAATGRSGGLLIEIRLPRAQV